MVDIDCINLLDVLIYNEYYSLIHLLFQTQFICTFFPRCSTPAPETETRIEIAKNHTNQNGEELNVKNSMVSKKIL